MACIHLKKAVLASALVMLMSTGPAHAQSEASLAASALPLASVVATASVAGGSVAAGALALSAVPVALSVGGAVLVVKAVEVSARGTVYLLERASDGARVSIELSGQAAQAASLAVGTAVVVGVFSAGVVLSAGGEVLAFIPNAVGRSLLHNERVAF